jgi:hypothetical protein
LVKAALTFRIVQEWNFANKKRAPDFRGAFPYFQVVAVLDHIAVN